VRDARLVCLVYLVGLVQLVYLVYLVCLVGRTGKPTKGTKESRQTKRTRETRETSLHADGVGMTSGKGEQTESALFRLILALAGNRRMCDRKTCPRLLERDLPVGFNS